MHILAISPDRDMEAPKWGAVAHSGIDALMLRERRLDARSLLALARAVMDMAPGLALWISGRVDVALELGAGFHGGEGCPEGRAPRCPVSRPIHDASQIQGRAACDQLLVSPVFEVPGKGRPLGAWGLRKILDEMPARRGKLLALGGINAGNVATLDHPRLDGVALMRGIWDTDDPRGAVEGLRSAWRGGGC